MFGHELPPEFPNTVGAIPFIDPFPCDQTTNVPERCVEGVGFIVCQDRDPAIGLANELDV